MAVVAELKGKLQGYKTADGARYVDAEDPLTASIFESIEVMERAVGLGAILREASGDEFTSEELTQAEFHYWLRDVKAFGDRTEPDLMITVGDCLYLLEAKYRSGLGQGTDEGPGQLEREWKGGMALTKKWRLSRFRLVCVVGDMSTSDEVSQFAEATGYPVHRLQWQDIHRIMADIVKDSDLDPRDRILAERCKALLERRKMGSFDGFTHLHAYKGGQGFYQEVFTFANILLHRLEGADIVRAVHEFRIERDGGQRSLAVGGIDQWAPTYFALPVQKKGDRAVEKRPTKAGLTRFYMVERFAFFMLDTGTPRLIVGRASAATDTWKKSTFWHGFFLKLKKSLDTKKTESLSIGDTTFCLDIVDLDAAASDLLEETSKRLVEYLS